jgi:hypothetical protein
MRTEKILYRTVVACSRFKVVLISSRKEHCFCCCSHLFESCQISEGLINYHKLHIQQT